jgi:diguanylate cyclase (GGDEF)-like protein
VVGGACRPGARAPEPGTIAERLRTAVEAADFAPEGARHTLTVSVGGATFNRPIDFSDLYRAADRRLYAAKEAGRNRVNLGAANLALAA